MSLRHSSDSLDSTWEREVAVPQSTALAETLPQGPRHHLDSHDRTRGSVAPATPTEFQDPLAPPARSPQNAAGRWERATTRPSRPADQAWKRTRTSPEPLPSRFPGSVGPQSPRPRPAQRDRSLPRHGATLANHSSSDAPKYGRGRLNYPLPDFSKVGPRVRFPKDESYRPPKSRSHNKQPQGPSGPLIFKSPAEIVREVLLSSGEASLAKDLPPAHPVTRVPQEFQTPEQATELVHQLQVSGLLSRITCPGPPLAVMRQAGVGSLSLARSPCPWRESCPQSHEADLSPLLKQSNDCSRLQHGLLASCQLLREASQIYSGEEIVR